jgi:quinol monooxygenase YgiN
VAKLAIIIKGKAHQGKRDEVRTLFEKHLAPRAVANAAQEVVVWSADNAEPDTFYLYEIYADPTTMEANASAPWFREYMDAVGPLLATQPELMTATPMWMKAATTAT